MNICLHSGPSQSRISDGFWSSLGQVSVIFLLPFFFVLDPSLILQGEIEEILRAISSTALGVFLIGSAFQGYMVGIGWLWPARRGGYSLGGYSLSSYFLRTAIIISGVLLGLPWWQTKLLGLAIAAVILLPAFLIARRQRARRTALQDQFKK